MGVAPKALGAMLRIFYHYSIEPSSEALPLAMVMALQQLSALDDKRAEEVEQMEEGQDKPSGQ